ncbi:hypothetical protein TNCT_285591 [Trichonephila clavata]|uniref:Uncharacterized protein n=1 Tax=Trichonephila clavata TaxID=2740835 RepID=A0A8X6GSX4_TRICU|nr:hypothetical protein TNCT_285591 [Trichonephila clavata]
MKGLATLLKLRNTPSDVCHPCPVPFVHFRQTFFFMVVGSVDWGQRHPNDIPGAETVFNEIEDHAPRGCSSDCVCIPNHFSDCPPSLHSTRGSLFCLPDSRMQSDRQTSREQGSKKFPVSCV